MLYFALNNASKMDYVHKEKEILKMTTAREFLNYAGVEVTKHNLWILTRYTESDIDFSQFPNAECEKAKGKDIIEMPEEPAGFQEYLAIHSNG